MDVRITIECCKSEQSATMEKTKKTKKEIKAHVLKMNSTFPCALCGKRSPIKSIEFLD